MTMRAPSSTSPIAPPTTSISQALKDNRARITAASAALSSALSGKAPSHRERPPIDTTTPQATITGVLNAFKQLPTDGPRAAYDLVERALADPVTQQPILKERFLTHLAASPALTARTCPHTAEPLKIDGAIATQRITYTLEDGTKTAAIFRATRRDPRAFESFPTASWQIDRIYPADSS